MMATKDIGEAIMELVEDLAIDEKPVFREVRRFPLSKLDDKTFKNDLVKLTLPACLIIFVRDNFKGRPYERTCDWILIAIFAGSEEAAGDACTNFADLIRSGSINVNLDEAGKVHLRPDSGLTMLESTSRYTAGALTLLTVERA